MPFGSDRRRLGVWDGWKCEMFGGAGGLSGESPSPFEMGEAEFAFEFLVVALDARAQFGRVDENVDGCVFGQGRKPVFRRLFFALGPFDEQPFQRMGRRNLPVPRSRAAAKREDKISLEPSRH